MLSCDVNKVTTARKSTFAKLHLFLSLCNAVHYIYLQRRGRKNKTQNKTISLFTNFESESLPLIHNQDFLRIYLQKLLLQ